VAELRQESCGIVLGETVRSPAHTVYKGTLLYIRVYWGSAASMAGQLSVRCGHSPVHRIASQICG